MITRSEEELKKIFSKNLNYYMSLQDKNQKEVAKAIDVIPTTFSSWVRGVSLPRMGKIEKLADYFGIEKTCLIEERNHNSIEDKYSIEMANLLNRVKNDNDLQTLIKNYLSLSNSQKAFIQSVVANVIQNL